MDIVSVFLRLVNISISASVFAIAIVLFRFIFKKSPKWLVVALWALVAVRLILPFSIESAMSLIPSKEAIPQEIFTVDTDTYSNTSFGFIENPAYSEYFNSTVTVDNVRAFQRDFEFASYIWLVGVGLMLLYALISYLRLRYTVRTAIPLKDNVWLCDSVKSPFILGVFRPRIYLSSDMDETTVELVLKHEKAHLKRKDHLWKPFGFVLLSVYWFNPVLWLSYILLCRDIELACDERVIRDMEASDKKAYSEALLTCSVSHRMISACPVAFGEVGVKKRIKSVLNYKKPAFWIILIAVVVSVVLALCFMTDPKGVNGGQDYINGIDEISEFKFSDLDDIIFSVGSYTVYHGNSTVDDYFETKNADAFSHSEVMSFLNTVTLGELADGVVNPMHEPQTNGSIDINCEGEWKIRVLFHDNFQKMYMERFKADGTSVRSKDYAVLEVEQARAFFTERPYMSHALVWEFNPASSAWGNGRMMFWLADGYKINGKIKGDGKLAKITNEDTGVEGVTWSPEIVNSPVEYNIEIPVICDGEEKVFNLTISMAGRKALSTYYTLRADDLVIASYPNGSYELSEAQTKEPDDGFEGFYDLDSKLFEQDLFVNLIMTSPVFIKNSEKEAVAYNGDRVLCALDEWEFEKGYYAHPSKEDLENMKKYSIEVDGDGGKTYGISFNKNCSQMWFYEKDGSYSSTFKVKNSGTVKHFFDEEKYFDDGFVWEYNPYVNTYSYSKLWLIVNGEYESYTATCESGSLMKADVTDDVIVGIVQSDPAKAITCTKEDNLVWEPDSEAQAQTETIHFELKLANGKVNDFYMYAEKLGTNYDGNAVYQISADYAKPMMAKQGNKAHVEFEQTYDVTWLYNPMAGATWFYITKFVLPEGYEIKSAEATSGAATIEDRYYNSPDNEKVVCWSPDYDAEEDTELKITAVKDGEEQEFRIFMNYFGDYYDDTWRKKYIISPINCKMKEEGIATFLLEEKYTIKGDTWYHNPVYYAKSLSQLTFTLPDGYTLASRSEMRSGKASNYDYNAEAGATEFTWSPEYYNIIEAGNVEMTVTAVRNKKTVDFKFTLVPIRQDEKGGTYFGIEPDGCKVTQSNESTYLLEEK